jgi:hypothetical protein
MFTANLSACDGSSVGGTLTLVGRGSFCSGVAIKSRMVSIELVGADGNVAAILQVAGLKRLERSSVVVAVRQDD